MSFRFLHIADLHLDTPFSGRPELKLRLQQAQRDTLIAAVDACLEHQVDALLIAGDLADQETVSYDTIAFVRAQLYRLQQAGVSVLYAHGNHDPASGALTLPPWVEIFDSRYARMVEIRGRDGHPVGAVVGAGFARAQEYTSMSDSFPRRHGSLPTVGLMHTQLIEEGGKGTANAPTSLSWLESMSYDYWALGHIHRRQSYGRHIYYSGCLCAFGYGDPGPHGALLVEVSGQGTPSVRFLPLAKIRFEELTVRNLAAVKNEYQFFELLRSEIENLQLNVPALLRISLQGESGCWQQLTGPGSSSFLTSLGQRLAQASGMVSVELSAREISAPAQAETYRQEVSLVGEMLSTLSAAQNDDVVLDQLLDALSPLGLAGCQHGSRQQQRDYARSLLSALEPQVLDRMRKEDNTR